METSSANNAEVRGFFGNFRFLSNFYDAPMVYNGVSFENAEAAFHAQKCPSRAAEFSHLNPSQAKRLGRRGVTLRKDWEQVKVPIMREIVIEKFKQNPDLAQRLYATAPAKLYEENNWGDMFWGQVHGKGENNLGKILMEVRDLHLV